MSGGHLRIIDANANRAREALRVMEDVARFVLDDQEVCAALKEARHGLRGALEDLGLDATLLTAWRDVDGDVGRSNTTEAEQTRRSVRDVAIAACRRATEAVRAIEECAKIEATSDASQRLESIRYSLYKAESGLIAALGSGGAQWSLCVLLTESLCVHEPWDRVAELAVEGGASCLQLREKSLSDAELLRRAHRLVAIAREARVDVRPSVVINDRPDIAMLVGADGVHLGQEDLPIGEVRRLVGASVLIGVSTSTLEEARAAVRAGADYCGVGPMFPTTTKEKPVLAGPAALRAYLDDPVTAGCPHLAIGGITVEGARELAALGCRGVAVSGAVLKHKRPAANSRAFCEVFAPTHWGDRRRGGGLG